MKKFRKPKYKIEDLFYSIICISLSAQLATLPLVLYYFHQFSLVSILANLVVLPFSEIIIVFSLLMVVVYAIGFSLKFLETAYDFFIDLLLRVIHFFANIDALFNVNISFSLVEVFISLIMLYYLRFLIEKFSYKSIVKFSFILLIFLSCRWILDFYYFNKNEILQAKVLKNKVLIIKENSAVTFVIDDSLKIKSLEKSVFNPYLTSRRTKNYQLIIAPRNTKSILYNKTKIDFVVNGK